MGMDIGATGIKFIVARQVRGEALTISHWFYRGPLLDADERELKKLREFLQTHKLSSYSVACNIEDASLKIRKVDLPKMPESDLLEAVRWQLRDAVEGHISEYSVRYSSLEEYANADSKRLSLIAYAIKKKSIRRLLDILRKLALNPVVVEPTSVSLLATFDALHEWKQGEFCGLVNLGEEQSFFTVVGDQKLYFSRPLVGVSNLKLKGMLERELGLKNGLADTLKEALLRKTPLEGDLAGVKERAEALLTNFHTQIAIEVQRSIDAFCIMFRSERVHQIFLCGGGASLSGLQESLTGALAIPTAILDPTIKFKIASQEPPYLYDVALGLAFYPL